MLHAEKRFQRATLKSWEKPGDEATIVLHVVDTSMDTLQFMSSTALL